jgi:hypothetical protein
VYGRVHAFKTARHSACQGHGKEHTAELSICDLPGSGAKQISLTHTSLHVLQNGSRAGGKIWMRATGSFNPGCQRTPLKSLCVFAHK